MAEKLIIDTDAGGDPDDALAIAVACRLPNVAAFLTSDETPNCERARLVQQIVNESGAEIPVFAGLQSPRAGKHIFEHVPAPNVPEPQKIGNGLLELLGGSTHWIGLGPYTNLEYVLRQIPGLGERADFNITLMGARLAEDIITRPEHNVKVDPVAAAYVASRSRGILFAPSTITMSEETRLGANHPILGTLREIGHRSVVRNFEAWFEYRFPASYQHDLLTLGIGCKTVGYDMYSQVELINQDRLAESSASPHVSVTGGVQYSAMWTWAESVLHSEPSRDEMIWGQGRG
jgi:inosine-uridine nucleoside N-ribohydrolase